MLLMSFLPFLAVIIRGHRTVSFAIPEDVRTINNHKELIKTPNFAKVKNTLKRRHQTRKVWIKVEGALKDTYIDEDENIQFMDQYSEEIVKEQEVENKDDLKKS